MVGFSLFAYCTLSALEALALGSSVRVTTRGKRPLWWYELGTWKKRRKFAIFGFRKYVIFADLADEEVGVEVVWTLDMVVEKRRDPIVQNSAQLRL